MKNVGDVSYIVFVLLIAYFVMGCQFTMRTDWINAESKVTTYRKAVTQPVVQESWKK